LFREPKKRVCVRIAYPQPSELEVRKPILDPTYYDHWVSGYLKDEGILTKGYIYHLYVNLTELCEMRVLQLIPEINRTDLELRTETNFDCHKLSRRFMMSNMDLS